MLILLVVLLLVFGPKRLPEMGRQIGKGMREFKDSVTGESTDDEVIVAVPPAEIVAAVPPADIAPVMHVVTETRERDNVA